MAAASGSAGRRLERRAARVTASLEGLELVSSGQVRSKALSSGPQACSPRERPSRAVYTFAVTIALDWDEVNGIWTLVPAERFTFEELRELLDKTDWQGARSFLWDLRDLRQGPDATSELREAADRVRRNAQARSGGRSAVVVGRDFDFAIARMFQVFSEGAGVEYAIFRDLDTARAWLIAGDSAEP